MPSLARPLIRIDVPDAIGFSDVVPGKQHREAREEAVAGNGVVGRLQLEQERRSGGEADRPGGRPPEVGVLRSRGSGQVFVPPMVGDRDEAFQGSRAYHCRSPERSSRYFNPLGRYRL